VIFEKWKPFFERIRSINNLDHDGGSLRNNCSKRPVAAGTDDEGARFSVRRRSREEISRFTLMNSCKTWIGASSLALPES
jgi:hypothetical protein